MNILLVDDERTALRDLENVVARAAPLAQICCADTVFAALEHVRANPVDIVFLDIQMPDMDGLSLARELKGIKEDINLIMVTGYSDYVMEAMKLYVSDYIVKPALLDDVRSALEHLRHPLPRANRLLRVQCFGDFDVFCEGVPLRFGRSKAKELLAFLVDRRGAAVNTGRICSVLWEADRGEKTKNYCRQVLFDLRRALRETGAEGVLVGNRDSYAVDPAKLDCDYYRFLAGDPAAAAAFHGEYMSQYSWAETTLGSIVGA